MPHNDPKILREEEDINAVLNEAHEIVDHGASKFPGMKYEEGLLAMYEWLTEEEPDAGPLDE